jgi:hypothetical protein
VAEALLGRKGPKSGTIFPNVQGAAVACEEGDAGGRTGLFLR